MPATHIQPHPASPPQVPAPSLRPAAIRLAIRGLDPAPFAPLFRMGPADLVARGIRKVVVPENPGIMFPCRVSLDYPEAGEEMLLLNHRHLDHPASPYRAEGPIFVRRGVPAFDAVDQLPPVIIQRPMAVRAYDEAMMMVEAEIADKGEIDDLARQWLRQPGIAHVDVHSMRRGCFFCRIHRG
ncbi:DUF1203 domain-containing protein [Rhabdaerophilum sp. SD176]|uniref:DUF1203 domain-containing protein n=1 Tax=Rhabdaerophilum sp. SD176 TaxID=2983548 RepID=UPI0024DFAA5A|nr:DUF1203 domain-containing protein [Rhabdaerophilum sp. SD176]